MDDRGLLAEMASIRRRTHADLNGDPWRWKAVWATVSFGFVLTLAIPSWSPFARWYWLVGVPVGIVGSGIAEYLDPTSDSRVRRRELPYWVTGAVMTVLISGGGAILPDDWVLVWLWVVMAGGFAALLRLDGEARLSRFMMGLSGAFAVIGLIAPETRGASIVCGTVFAAGLLGMARESHRRPAP